MIGLILAPIIYCLLILVLIKQIKFYNANYKHKTLAITVSVIALILLPLTIVIGFLLPLSSAKRVFTSIGNYWIGLAINVFVALLICLVVRLIFKLILKEKYNKLKAQKITNIITVIFAVIMTLYGMYNAHNLRTTVYNVDINKESAVDKLNVVQISDIHLGYSVGVKEVEDMVNKINALNPDIVVMTGDLFDNEYSSLDDPQRLIELFKSIKTKYGKYAIYGNHDIEEKIFLGFTFSFNKKDEVTSSKEMDDFVKEAGFAFLYDDYATIKDNNDNIICYVYGRPDYEKPNLGNNTRIKASDITKDIDTSKPIICLDHEPREMNELAKAKVDLDLTGHTHNGQVWPGTITINWFWDLAYGSKKYDDMTLVVSSGVGLFGPNIRTGCYPEIVQVLMNIK